MGPRASAIDQVTQTWVRSTGHLVDLRRATWLDGPIGDPQRIAHNWLPREARRLEADTCDGGGLLGTMNALADAGFDPSRLAQPVIDFYEQTAAWRLDVRTQWYPVAVPGGWLVSALFARRLQQLAIPVRSLRAAHGMDSNVITLRAADGSHLGAAWLRTLRSNGRIVYSGFYSTARLPGSTHTSIRVAFPLPNGSITVFLRPSICADGSLVLTSPIAGFGEDGAYLIVRDDNYAWVRRVPLAERFHVYVDGDGTLRTDHSLHMWTVPVLRFHYRLTRE